MLTVITLEKVSVPFKKYILHVPGSQVVNVSACDDDLSSPNNDIAYSLEGNH